MKWVAGDPGISPFDSLEAAEGSSFGEKVV
jgi:hypothetical protein